MDLFSKLTMQEKNAICDYIYTYGGYEYDEGSDGGTMKAGLDHILRVWNTNKADLFKVFGKELILSKDISIKKPFEILEDEVVSTLLNASWLSPITSFIRSYNRFLHDTMRDDENYSSAVQLISSSTLTENVYNGQSFSIPNPKRPSLPIQVHKGCKASKILGKIATAYNLENYEDFRIAHSQALNQKILKGTLCLSIHPLDFMTMSDNECGWESCMSWRAGGDYRQGTVEMMNSTHMVVAYLKSDTDMDISGFNWSNKKWRQLFVVNPSIILGIRQYPYHADDLQGIALNWLRDLVRTNYPSWGIYTRNACKINNCSLNTVAEFGIQPKINFHMNHMYNDIHCDHLAYVSKNINSDWNDFYLSGPSECMSCGEIFEMHDSGLENHMLICRTCEGGYRCSECEDFIPLGEECLLDGYYYCECCYNEVSACCEECGSCEYSENMIDIYPCLGDKVFSEVKPLKVCYDCFRSEDAQMWEEFGPYREIEVKEHYYRNLYSCVDVRNFTSSTTFYFFWPDDDDVQRIIKEIEIFNKSENDSSESQT